MVDVKKEGKEGGSNSLAGWITRGKREKESMR